MEASNPSNLPKGNRNRLLLGIGVIAVIVIIVVIVLLMNNNSNKDGNPGGATSGTLKPGDYLYYNANVGSVATSYVWMNVTSTDANSYAFQINNNGMEYPQTFSKTAVIDPLNMYGSTLSPMGKTSITTPVGPRSVNHYHGTASGTTVDYYVGDNMIVYKAEYTVSSLSITMMLQSSNVSWA